MKEYYGYIYKTTNLINGKIYIGQKKGEIKKTNYYLGSGKYFLRAVNKYGKENFDKEILYNYQNQKEANEKEIYYIAYYRKLGFELYNLTNGGEGMSGYIISDKTREKLRICNLGKKQSKKTKEKKKQALSGKKCYLYGKTGKEHPCFGQIISKKHKKAVSEAQKGKKLSDKTKEKLRQINLGKTLSEETKQKISIKSSRPRPQMRGKNSPLYNIPRSKETKRKISEANRGENHHNFGKKLSEKQKKKISNSNKGKHIFSEKMKKFLSENQKGEKGYWFGKKGKDHPNSRPVYQINRYSLEIIKKWDSISEAATCLNLHTSLISKVCLKKRTHTGGFKWEYVN